MGKKNRPVLIWIVGGAVLCMIPIGMGGALSVGSKAEVLKSRFTIEDAMRTKNWDEMVKLIPENAERPEYLSRKEVQDWIRKNIEPIQGSRKWQVDVRDEHLTNHDRGSFSFGFGYERWKCLEADDLPVSLPIPIFVHDSVFRVYVYQHNFVIGKTIDKDGLAKLPYDCEVIAPRDRFEMGESILKADFFQK